MKTGTKVQGNGAGPTTRIAPHSVEAEESLLGSVLINPETLPDLSDTLAAGDFFIVRHRWIWEAMAALYARRDAIDYTTLIDELAAAGRLEEAGGPAYITHLVTNTPTSLHAETYARIVQRSAVRRRLLDAASEIGALAHDEEREVEQVIDDAEAALLAATERHRERSAQLLKETLSAYYDQIVQMYAGDGAETGVPTGFHDLDAILGGLQGGDLVIVAGRTGMGKTSWLLNVAMNAAKRGARAGIFSLEMKNEQLAHRFLAMETGIDSQKLRQGQISKEEWERFVQAMDRLAKLPVYLDDTQGVTPAQLRSQARRWWVRDGLDLVAIDYVQRMRAGTQMDRYNRVQALAEITGALKDLAGELNVPVLAAAQLNRDVDQRRDKRPQLSDLRESGSLEMDADVVLFLFSEGYYDPDSEKANIVEVEVAKHRNGPTGTVELFYRRELTRFSDVYKRTIDLGSM
jgi:replicative DNA helicase